MRYLFMLIAWLTLAANATAQKHTSKDSAVTLTVYGNCEQCKQRIETAVKGRGVTTASWDIDSKVLSLVFNPSVISLDRIEQKKLPMPATTPNTKRPRMIHITACHLAACIGPMKRPCWMQP